MSEISDTLNAAADLLEREGWCQGFRRMPIWHKGTKFPVGSYCMAGAVSMVTTGSPWDTDTRVQKVSDALGESLGVRCVAHWNDRPGRTQDEAIAALRQAAQEWE